VAQVFTRDRQKIAAFLPVDRGFRGLHVMRGSRLDLDKAQRVFVPANQVNFTAAVGRSKIARDHCVSLPSKIKIGIFFASPSGAQMFREIVRRQGSARDPIKDANRGVRKTAGEHRIFVAPASRRPKRQAESSRIAGARPSPSQILVLKGGKRCDGYHNPKSFLVNKKNSLRKEMVLDRTLPGPDAGDTSGEESALFADAQPIQKHLFDRFVIRHQHMANCMSTDEMANLLGQVFGVVAGALQGLSHEDDLQAGVPL